MGRGLLGRFAPIPAGALATCLALLALLALLVVDAAPARAGHGRAAPEPGHPWFGPALDIEVDTPEAYADRLGATPSLYTFPADLPITDEGRDQLHRFAVDVAAQGAVLVLQLEPTLPLTELTPDHHADAADLVAGLAQDPGVQTLVRFAPEMNGSWRPWGQQPERFVTAFRDLAAAVHAAEPTAAMVWSPVYGSGYPFREETGADSEIDLSGDRQLAPLDTNGSGRLDEGDDPYGPYYPGDDAVDWTGLFLYRFGQSQGVRRNEMPPPDELASRLDEEWGYPEPGRAPFYDRFSAPSAQPMLLETAALHNPAVAGAEPLALTRRWWREVLAALPEHPLIGGISWLELSREEPEVADQPVDWGATRTPGLAAALRADLEASPVALGPVHEPVSGRSTVASTAPSPPRAEDLGAAVSGAGAGSRGARVAGALLVGVLLAVVLGARRPEWAYPGDVAERDRRVDLVRGGLLVTALALHLPVEGPLGRAAAGAVALGGLETFVAVSGISVGLAYAALATRIGHTAAVGRRLRRGLQIWIGAVVAVIGTYVLALLPVLDLGDIGTVGTSETRTDLYAGARRLFDYPPPGWIARDLLGFQLGSWLILPLALLVALHLLAPLAAGPLVRGWWWAVLPASWGLYAVGRWTGATLLPAWSEAIAPLLVWQVLFVHGVALARHRGAVAAALTTTPGRAGLALMTVGSATLLWLGRAPATSSATLPLPRLIVVGTATILALAVLTTCWRPVARVCARVLEPVGRVPLTMILVQPVLVLVVASLPAVGDPWIGSLATVGAGAALVLLAHRRSPQPAGVRTTPSSSSRSTTARVRTR